VTSVKKGTLEMPHRVLGQTVYCLDLFPIAGVTAEAVFEQTVQMVTSAFARFVSLSYKYQLQLCSLGI
jgi:hypothetical protein